MSSFRLGDATNIIVHSKLSYQRAVCFQLVARSAIMYFINGFQSSSLVTLVSWQTVKAVSIEASLIGRGIVKEFQDEIFHYIMTSYIRHMGRPRGFYIFSEISGMEGVKNISEDFLGANKKHIWLQVIGNFYRKISEDQFLSWMLESGQWAWLPTFGSSNGLSPVRRQGITWTNADQIGPQGTKFGESFIKKNIHKKHHPGKCISKCQLENIRHFIPDLMC